MPAGSPVRVYRYGLLPPTENGEIVRDQMRLAHRYRNALVEIERARRAAEREARGSYADIPALEQAVREADAAVESAVKALRHERAITRRLAVAKELKAAVDAAKAKRKEASVALFDRRKALREDPELQRAIDAINERAAEQRREARAKCGVYWGTYLLIEDAMQASSKLPLYDGVEANDPRFVRWTGDGQIGVQIGGGMPIAEVFADDRRLRIAPVDVRAWQSPVRGERRRYSRTVLSMRVCSEGRDPVWAAFPMVMHREIPEGSVIKRATVSLRYCGPREVWSAEITVELPATAPRLVSGDTSSRSVVAIDLGWRQIGDELRVAMTDSGTELRLDARLIGQLRKADELRSIRDESFNRAKEALVSWIRDMDQPAEWLTKATAYLPQWRSQAKLAALARTWKTQRFDGDTEAYEALEAWRYHDHHLWEWETSQRAKSLRHRREVYRIFAATLARKYSVLVLEKLDLRELAKLPTAESEKRENETARSNRQLASTSELRSALVQAFRSRGGEVVQAPAEYTTKTCHACKAIVTFDAAEHLQHKCEECGAYWDQDRNAAINLVTSYRERSGDEQNAGIARSENGAEKQGRWARAKEKRAAKEQRMAIARNDAEKLAG